MKKQAQRKLNLTRETLIPLQSLDGVNGGQAGNPSVTVCGTPTITVCSLGFTLPVCCGMGAPGGDKK